VTLGDRVYLFASTFGATTNAYTTDTWAFDGSTWTLVPSIGLAPAGPYGFGASAFGNVALLYGGYINNGDGQQSNQDDTFTWNGTSWTDPDMFSGYPACIMGTVNH